MPGVVDRDEVAQQVGRLVDLAKATRATRASGRRAPFSPRPIAPAVQCRPGSGRAQREQRDPGVEPCRGPSRE